MPTYAQTNTFLQVSESAGNATADATEYAGRLGIRDGVIAARDAARSASSWITIGAYGTGAAPVLDGSSSQMIGIDLSGPNSHYVGGWKVDEVEVHHYLWCGIRAEAAAFGAAKGLWITSLVNVHHISGYSFSTTFPYTYNVVSGSYFFAPQGIAVNGVKYADIAGTYNSNATAYWVWYSDYACIDGANAQHSGYLGPYLAGGINQVWQNSTMDSMCDGAGLATGSTAMTMGDNTNVVIYNCVAKNTPLRTQDGTGADLETACHNMLFLGCTFSGNADAGIETLPSPGNSTYTMVIGCTFANNGIGYSANSVGGMLFTSSSPNDTSQRMICVSNTITRATSPAQTFLFSARNTTLSNTITDVYTQGIFGPDNTVI